MKFIVNTDQLLNKLQAISGTIVSKPVIPILDHFLFTIKDKILLITATDLETSMTVSAEVQADEDVSIAVPSRTCMETLRSLPNQPVTFTIDPQTSAIEIRSEFGRYKLVGQPGNDFPKLAELDDANSFAMSAATLSNCISKTIFATGNDEIRLALTGVFVELFENNITFVATDANRLVKVNRADVTPGVTGSFILPKKALTLLKSNLPVDDSLVKIEWNGSNAFFAYNDVNLICRLIDERYPEYSAVIPKENPNKLTLVKRDFLNSIKRISIFANKSTHQVNLKITGSELTVYAEDIDLSNEAVEKIGCDFVGEDMEIGFNAKLMLDLILNLNTNNIDIEMSTPNRAGIILPEVNEENETLLMLIMPMMVNR